MQISKWVVLLALVAAACGVTGDKGLAVFHVGANWQKTVGIAVGSTFAVSAEKNDLTHSALLTSSGLPSVAKMPDGSFQAVQAGAAQFQAQDASTKALVDTVEFTVAAAATASLGAWWTVSGAGLAKLPKKFALVQGARYVGGIVVEDSSGARLNHAGIATVTCPGMVPKVTDMYVEVTATNVGPATATLDVTGGAGAAKISTTYDIVVVTPKDIATMTLLSGTTQVGTTPTDPDKAPVPNDSGGNGRTAVVTQWFSLITSAALADGTPVYGAQAIWTESGTGHLLVKNSSGGNYAHLTKGESVTVTATIGTLSKQVILTGP